MSLNYKSTKKQAQKKPPIYAHKANLSCSFVMFKFEFKKRIIPVEFYFFWVNSVNGFFCVLFANHL